VLKVNQNSVEQRPATSERFVAPNFGLEQIGQGAAALGQGLAQATGNLDDIGKMYDEAAVKQADADDLKRITEIRANALASQGFDAQSAIKDARDQIAEIRNTRLADLHNPRQRQMYTDVFDARNLQIEESFANHSITETKKAEQSATLARADSYTDLSVDTYGTDAFDLNMGTALKEVANANKGAAPDAIARKQAEVRSSIFTRVISGMLADPNSTDVAKLTLDKHAADILPQDEEKLRRALNPLLEEAQTEADAGWAFTDAAKPSDGETPTAPTEGPDTPPRPQIKTPETVTTKPISPADPLRGKGRITDDAAAHRERGSGNALDIAAPSGTPIYPPMSGKVVKSWWDAKGGWSVLVQHPNGYVTGYAHLRSKSPFAEGQEVDASSVIGSVGATGDATGPHVHYTVRQSAGGPKVDPSAALWGPGGVKANSVAWKEAEPTRYAVEDNSLGRALTRLHDRAAAENWSPHRYQKAVEKVRSIAGIQTQLYNDQQDALYDTALKSVVALGDKLMNRSQIPSFGLLDPKHQVALQNIIDSNVKAAANGDNIKANGPRFLQLMGMAQSPEFRNQFLSVDLMGETGITNAERARLWSNQLELRQQPEGPLAAGLGKANFFVERYMPKTAFKEDQRRKFSDAFMAAVERQQGQLHRPLTDREMDDIARAQTVEVVRPGGGVVRAVELRGTGQGGTIDIPKVYNQIAPDVRQRLVDELAQQGKDHSMRAVVEYYLSTRSR
jgi:murein DD-endopeptidase MepM/ murein hydrolase activator NlpD